MTAVFRDAVRLHFLKPALGHCVRLLLSKVIPVEANDSVAGTTEDELRTGQYVLCSANLADTRKGNKV